MTEILDSETLSDALVSPGMTDEISVTEFTVSEGVTLDPTSTVCGGDTDIRLLNPRPRRGRSLEIFDM